MITGISPQPTRGLIALLVTILICGCVRLPGWIRAVAGVAGGRTSFPISETQLVSLSV
jgi:hypothetical protein